MKYAVFDKFTNAFLCIVDSIDEIDPVYYNYQVVPDTSGEDTTIDEEIRWDAGSGEFVVDYTKLEEILKKTIDNLREEAQGPAVTEGYGKAQEYAGKAAEILLFDIMDPAQFAGLSDEELYDKFTYAYEDAAVYGGTIIEALERFREGARSSKYLLAKQAAAAQITRTLVKLESTPTLKRQALLSYGTATGTKPPSGVANPVDADVYITTESGEALETEQRIAILV